MDYGKSLIFNPVNNKLKEVIKKQYSIPTEEKENKRKSDDIHFYNFLSKLKLNQKYKVNKIPKNHRFSYEDKNALMSNLILPHNSNKNNNNNNNENYNNKKKLTVKKDSNYYLNLVHGIYSNDSHLSNNNIVKMNSSHINFMKGYENKKTFNFSKRTKDNNSTKKSGSKTSKIKLSYCSNDMRLKSEKKINVFGKSIKKFSLGSKENEKTKKLSSEKCQSKFYSTKGISKFKKNENSNSKNKSSRNLPKRNSAEFIQNTITSILPKEIKMTNNIENDKNNKNNEKEILKINKNEKVEIEIEKCDTNNNRIIPKNSNTNKKQRNYRCLFCCFNNNNNSVSDNE